MSIGTRIRELKKCILHERNKVRREIFKSHIEFLKTQRRGHDTYNNCN